MPSPSTPLPVAEHSFWSVVSERAAEGPDRPAFTFLADGETPSAGLTYGELDRAARAVAVGLREALGAPSGGDPAAGRVLLLLAPGLDFVTAFLGCLYAGAVAVPAYPPRPGRGEGRIRALLADARPHLAVSAGGAVDRLVRRFLESAPGTRSLTLDELSGGDPRRWRPPAEDPDAVAFLQYTSGSTASPRGVEVTHRGLAANERAIQRAFDQSEDSVVVGWLPLYHDMGLVGNVLQPLWCGGSCVLMSPAAFLQRPRRWLEAIDRYRGTTSGGPDFGYALTARKVAPAERRGLDLSSWRVAFDGAEPVRAATLDAFTEAFGPAGFRREAFLPCYGLAEATLFVSGAPPGQAPEVLEVSAPGLEAGRAEAEPGGRRLVSCGRPGLGVEVRVVDPRTAVPRPAGEVGEVWVAGESVARGYFGRPEETAETFGGRLGGSDRRWLRTGDLGFLSAGGELVVTGRSKDLIVVRGRNLYPQDVERSAEGAHPALRPGGAAAFGVEEGGEERLVVAVEVERRRERDAAAAAAAAHAAVVAEHEVAVAAVVPLRAGGLPRTSSGKVRRGECRRRYLAGTLEASAGVPEGGRDRPTGGGEDAGPAEGDPAGEHTRYLARTARSLGAPVGDDPAAPLLLDSLQAMELRNRIAADLGVELPVGPFLEGEPIEGLARRVEAAAGADRGAVGTLPVSDPGAPPPVTAGQRAFWLLERLGGAGRAEGAASPYVVVFAARVAATSPVGHPTPAALARALAALVDRHPALRTVYPAAAGEPAARVLPAGPAAVDLRVLEAPAPGPDGAGALRGLLADEAARPFDLETGPVLRARIVPAPAPAGAPVLLLAIHHVAVDLWSLEVLVDELARLLAGTDTAVLGDPPPPFGAFARWQEALPAGRGEALRAFWRDELAGAPHVLELPPDRPRPAAAKLSGERLSFTLPEAAVQGVRALAAASGVTLFPVLLAAWAALLGRLTGRDDLLVGSPATGRTRPGFEGSVGYFANLLPIRAELTARAGAGEPTFAGLVGRVRSRTVRALEHQDLPFPAIVEALAPARERSRHPLVQAALVLERPHRLRQPGAAPFVLGSDGASVELGPVRLEAVALPARAVQLDLMLVAAEASGVLATCLDFSTELFDRTTIARWAGSFGTLLAAAAAAPDRPLADLPLLTPPERAQLLREWNDTAPADPRAWDRTIQDLVAARAREAPDAVAVEAAGPAGAGGVTALTYGELLRRARRLAVALRAAGAGPERAVAVDLDRSPELVVALLAVLEAGSYYVPLDRAYPPPRLRAMVAATRPAVLVTLGAPAIEIPGATVIDLATVREAGQAADLPPVDLPLVDLPPEALAYVVFTSGSTGEPKGIAVSHRAVVRLVDRPEYVRLGPDDALLQLAPVPFDASTFEIWGLLAAGGRLLVTPPGPVSPGPLGRDLVRHRATVVWLTAGLFHLMVDAGPGSGLSSVRQVVTGGDVVSPDHVRRALTPVGTPAPTPALTPIGAPGAAARAGRRVVNGYGPTEGTTFTATSSFSSPEEVPSPVPLGGPLAGTRTWIADSRLRPVPAGVPGELLIGGAGLARGYVGKPGSTAERFVPDTLSGAPGERLYRSGDLARFDSAGRLGFLGRLDTQVKVRGFRVEVGEVEAALRRCPGVRAAAVVRRGDALAAFLVGSPPEAGELRERLSAELPAFMVPATFTALDALPLGAAGKVDRAALARRSDGAPAQSPGAAQPSAARRPRSELERTLTALWAEALELPPERVDPEASFFDLGGHSLGMARLHGRLTAALGEEIPIVELFDHPSVAAMARWLRARTPALAEGPSGVAAAAATAATPGDRAAHRQRAMRRRRTLRTDLEEEG